MKEELKFTNIGNKENQKELIKEIMDLDAKDGLYEISDEEIDNSIRYDSIDPYVQGYIDGAKWYRKQLRNKQNFPL
jgi:hypothetical protein